MYPVKHSDLSISDTWPRSVCLYFQTAVIKQLSLSSRVVFKLRLMFSNCLEVCLVIYFSKLLSWKGGVCRHFSPAGNCGSNFPHVKLWLKSFGCLFKLIGMKNLWQNSLFKTALYISWKNFSWQYSRKVSSTFAVQFARNLWLWVISC